MIKAIRMLSVFTLLLMAFVACDDSGNKTDNDTTGQTDDTVNDTATDDQTDTTPTDDAIPATCGNGTTDTGEMCDGDAKDCSQIAGYISGWAECKSDCSGYDTSTCTVDPDADIPTTDDPATDDPATDDVVSDADQPVGPVTFLSTVVDAAPDKPAFVGAVDIDNDGYKELIISKFANSSPVGSGYLDLYKMATPGNYMTWNKTRLISDIKFPAVTSYKDLDDDGDLDIIVPGGFLACTPFSCGMLAWLEQDPMAQGGWVRHNLVSGQQRFYHHAEHADIDGDGIKDLVACGEEKGMTGDGSTETHYFKGDNTADRFAKSPTKIFSTGLGSVPTLYDIDNDGDLDLFSGEYFGSAGSFAWLRNKGGNGGQEDNWEKFYIDNQHGKAIQFSFIEDLCGDGVTRAVGANHTNTMDTPSSSPEAIYMYEIPADPTQPWPSTKISDNMQSRKSPAGGPQGAPGVFAHGDIDGDGDIDIIVSGDGNPNFFWLEQTVACTFVQKVFAENMPQGGVAIADFNNDGRPEVVTSSYESNQILLWYVQ